ncbi:MULTISPECIES: DNA methyltransferase [unclassified Bradyrhizobium]|uniref:DNA methyltransferase n=1 Tax=unclassified Bradyrhizobium TaxID=2631580 RepID=UPI0029168DEC|nr:MULTISPECIES: DNA methyltransferase [unclassified Bradyrhizobium]
MPISWNEVRTRASRFAEEWKSAKYEKGDAQTFYNEFFQIFGVERKRVAVFEKQVRKLDNSNGFIDLFWPGQLVIEQKSAGKDLTKASQQALDYCSALKPNEHPRYILVSDFQNFELYDLQDRKETAFRLSELTDNIELFGFILGREIRVYSDQPAVNIEAAELMGAVHDALEETGYRGHDLERFLVRLLFCLFADSTGIFEPRGIFQTWLHERTAEDGSTLGAQLIELFQVLDTEIEKRAKTLDDDLKAFPYINGDLFKETLKIPSFNSAIRDELINASQFKWEKVSPAIFGSLFQSVMKKEERRQLGAHYTTEKNIMKVLSTLFLDDLRDEFQGLKARRDTRRTEALKNFHTRLSKLNILDPACGCGNFLIIAYRELRQLETDTLVEIRKETAGGGQLFDPGTLSVVDVDQFYGIEIDEFPARVAETAMWMMDHIMNNRFSVAFGQPYLRIPLKKAAHITQGNALEIDWEDVLTPSKCSYIVGNPPFRGHQWRTAGQQADMARVWGNTGQLNRLDYVTCWFRKAVDYSAKNREIGIGFVSTNSITQGEQSGILWPRLFGAGVIISFAHRTFQWNSEARGAAAVHCVIIGMTRNTSKKRLIYDYAHLRGDPHVTTVKSINGYLIDGPQYAVPARTVPPAGQMRMHKGSQPTDGARLKKPEGGYVTTSNLILDDDDKKALVKAAPITKAWLRPFVGGDELISGNWRWCLWLKDAKPSEIKACRPLAERLERVRQGRLQSPTKSVRDYAKFPTLFTQDRQPDVSYLAIPEVSSETRDYIPMAILEPNIVASNKLQIIPGAPLYYLGILTSAMHMAWMRTVAGRLKSDYSYAPAVYNSFPWPALSSEDKKRIEALTKAILTARKSFADSTLDDLYGTDSMPPALRRAHEALDAAVDRLYRKAPFAYERERVEYLFSLYEKTLLPLAAKKTKKKSTRKRSAG